MDNNTLKDIIERVKRNSCVSEKIPVNGETYVSKRTKQRKKKDLKEGISTFVAIGAVAVTIFAGGIISNTMDFATEVRKEVNDTYIDQNLIGGNYVEKKEHDEEFRDYVADLNDFKLSKLFNETSKQMQDDEMLTDGVNVEDVVDQMEENYLESISKGK